MQYALTIFTAIIFAQLVHYIHMVGNNLYPTLTPEQFKKIAVTPHGFAGYLLLICQYLTIENLLYNSVYFP